MRKMLYRAGLITAALSAAPAFASERESGMDVVAAAVAQAVDPVRQASLAPTQVTSLSVAPAPVVPMTSAQPSPPATEERALSDTELTEQRGGRTIVLGNQTLTAVTAGNVLVGDFTAGEVNLSDNSLSNFNGLGNLLINTGAQVSLQSAMNVVINLGGGE